MAIISVWYSEEVSSNLTGGSMPVIGRPARKGDRSMTRLLCLVSITVIMLTS